MGQTQRRAPKIVRTEVCNLLLENVGPWCVCPWAAGLACAMSEDGDGLMLGCNKVVLFTRQAHVMLHALCNWETLFTRPTLWCSIHECSSFLVATFCKRLN